MYTLPKHGQLCDHKVDITLYEPKKHVLAYACIAKKCMLIGYAKNGHTCSPPKRLEMPKMARFHSCNCQKMAWCLCTGFGRIFSISNCSGLEWPWKIAHSSYGLGPSFGLHGLPMAGSTFAGWLLGGLGLSGILGLGGLGVWGSMGLLGLAPALWWTPSGWNPSMVPCSWCSVEAGKASTSTPMTSCNSGTSLPLMGLEVAPWHPCPSWA